MKLLNSNKFCLYILTLLVLSNTIALADVFDPYDDTSWVKKDDPGYIDIDNVRKKYEKQIDVFAWGGVFKDLADDFRHTEVDWSDKLDIKQKFQNELDSLVINYQDAAKWSAISARSDVNEILEHFATDPFGKGRNDKSDFVYFSGSKRSNEIMFYLYDENMEKKYSMSKKQAADLRYRAETIDKLLKKDFAKPARTRTLNAISKAESKWKNYLEKGFSQYPWESLLNSHITYFDIQNPPGHQWILLHPELGVEISTEKINQLKAKAVLTVEVAGWINYYGKDLENFWGISGIVTLRDDIGIGIGGTIHIGPHFNLGITWHDVDDNDNFFNDSPFVTMGIDLFKFAGPRIPKFEEQIAQLESAEKILKFAKQSNPDN